MIAEISILAIQIPNDVVECRELTADIKENSHCHSEEADERHYSIRSCGRIQNATSSNHISGGSMIIGLVSLVVKPHTDIVLGVKCPRRGWILPGGKWEEFEETWYEGAARELKEETNANAVSQKLIFHAACGEGSYSFTFLTEIDNPDTDFMWGDVGKVDWITWDTLMESWYKAYYQILKEIYERHDH